MTELFLNFLKKHVFIRFKEYRYYRRVKDVNEIWKTLLKQHEDVHKSRAAFHLHMLCSDHWRYDYTSKEIHMFAQSLTFTTQNPPK